MDNIKIDRINTLARKHGTLFVGQKKEEFYLLDYIEKLL